MEAQTLGALGAMFREAIEKHVKTAVEVLSESFGKALQERDEKIAALEARKEYDDTDLRERIDTVAKSIPAPYDDSGLVDRLSKQLVDAEMRLGAKQSQEVEAILNRIKDARYDDTALRAEMDVLLKGVDVQLDCIRKSLPQDGKPGQDGTDGRDALQLEVLPAIDEQKSYTRGTYAKHAGGLWRSFEQTSGMRGWECIVDGVASLTAEMHGKSLVVRAIQSSGTEAILHATLPVQTYKGVFAQGSEYEVGDTATWGGSVWHCNVTGTKAFPGDGSKDWTQAVKKGRDYREPVKTERVQGPVKIGGAA